jgi:hypothetical protein
MQLPCLQQLQNNAASRPSVLMPRPPPATGQRPLTFRRHPLDFSAPQPMAAALLLAAALYILHQPASSAHGIRACTSKYCPLPLCVATPSGRHVHPHSQPVWMSPRSVFQSHLLPEVRRFRPHIGPSGWSSSVRISLNVIGSRTAHVPPVAVAILCRTNAARGLTMVCPLPPMAQRPAPTCPPHHAHTAQQSHPPTAHVHAHFFRVSRCASQYPPLVPWVPVLCSRKRLPGIRVSRACRWPSSAGLAANPRRRGDDRLW